MKVQACSMEVNAWTMKVSAWTMEVQKDICRTATNEE